MKILITGGNTQIPIDQVRVISNIFKGKTAVDIAKHAIEKGHEVTLVGNPHMHLPVIGGINKDGIYYDVVNVNGSSVNYRFVEYKTYDDLMNQLYGLLLKDRVGVDQFDAIIHSAAVSDYTVEGVYSGSPHHLARLQGVDTVNLSPTTSAYYLSKLDNDKKVSSEHKELFLKLIPTQKIVDLFRSEWGFKGKIVKFKLQVGITDKELIEIAQKSRATSDADLIVANCLEWAKDKAYIIDRDGIVERVKRSKLAEQLLDHLEGKV